ncbi:MAG: class I SAM-dependent methyltransferase, partial [Gammaproteobacteria bacterium]
TLFRQGLAMLRKSFTICMLIVSALVLQACEQQQKEVSVVSPDEEAVSRLENILAGDHRSPENKNRDQYRHPVETLSFFSVTPDATVVEIWPGAGWYTEILAPYLRDEGRYIAAGFDPESDIEFIRMAAGRYQAKLDGNPELYDKVETTVLMPPNQLDFAEPESVDIILTFRSIHNWMPRGSQDLMVDAMYRALKPGGILGVVEHRGDPAVPQDPKAANGYVNQVYAIEMVEKAGFVLNGSSEVNANPADTRDHPEGVWTLPPTLRMKDERRDHWISIGESDRFTLRFIKPEA